MSHEADQHRHPTDRSQSANHARQAGNPRDADPESRSLDLPVTGRGRQVDDYQQRQNQGCGEEKPEGTNRSQQENYAVE